MDWRLPTDHSRRGADPLIALLLPSYRRFRDLFTALSNTPVSPDCKFIVVANYPDEQLSFLKRLFSKKALFIDERPYGKGGMIKAYNIAYEFARENGFKYAALWADDLMPQKTDWLKEIDELFVRPGHLFGIFSTDECHKKHFGWNFFNGTPNAHFFIADISVLGDYFLRPELNAYVGDYEVCVRMAKKNIPMTLLPVRLNHNHTPNPTREKNNQYYAKDLEIFNRLHPELAGVMDDVVLKGDYASNGTFIVDSGKLFHTNDQLNFKSYSDFLKGSL